MFDRLRKTHYGYRVFLLCFLFQLFVVTLQYHAPGQFVAPMAEEMELSRQAIVSTLTVSAVTSMVMMLFAGSIFKRVNLRWVFCVCLTVFSSLYYIQSYAVNLTQIYIIAVVRGILTPFCSMYPMTIVLNNWFGKKVIGKYIAFAMIGNSIGSIIMNPVIGYLIRDFGWRICYRVVTFLPLAVLPLIAVFLVVTPEEKGLSRIGEVSGENELSPEGTLGDGLSSKQAIGTSVFWITAVMFLFWSGSTQTWQLVWPSFLADSGRDPVAVAAVLSVSAFGNLLAKVILGQFYQKNPRNGLIFGFCAGLTAFILAMVSGRLQYMAFAASFLFGFCLSTVGVVPPLLTSELFGRKDYGVISGFIQIGGSVGSSLLPLVMTALYSAVGSYLIVWVMMSVLVLLAVFLLFTAFRLGRRMNITKMTGEREK